MFPSDLKLIGTLAKLHSFKGRFLLLSEVVLSEEIENWESVFIETDGLPVPFFIDYISISSDYSAIIGFENIDSPEKAKEFLNCRVHQDASIAGEEDFVPSQLKGYKVTDQQAGFVGEVDQIVEYSHNVLLRVMKKKQEILIPINGEIILKVNHKKKEVVISAPKGLLELYQ